MTIEKLIKITKDLPRDAKVMSDSGWECDATDCDGVYYSKELNIIVLTQGDDPYKYSSRIQMFDEERHKWMWVDSEWETLFNEVKKYDN